MTHVTVVVPVQVRVNRKRILDSAAKVMEMYANSKALLELEYFDEAGTGLGPTLEFYALLAQEVQRKSLGMWRCEHGCSGGGRGTAAIKAQPGTGEGLHPLGETITSAPKAAPLQVPPRITQSPLKHTLHFRLPPRASFPLPQPTLPISTSHLLKLSIAWNLSYQGSVTRGRHGATANALCGFWNRRVSMFDVFFAVAIWPSFW